LFTEQSKEEFVHRAKEQPAYKKHKDITQFLLFAATHDTVPDETRKGLVKASRVGMLDMLNYSTWATKDLTIEHVAPKGQANGWPDELCEDSGIVHRIGNLTLLPKRENQSVSNRSWQVKRLIYRILSSDTPDDIENLQFEATEKGIELSSSTDQILEGAQYLPHVKAIGSVENEWDLNMIDQRSECLLLLAWTRIAPWIGLE